MMKAYLSWRGLWERESKVLKISQSRIRKYGFAFVEKEVLIEGAAF